MSDFNLTKYEDPAHGWLEVPARLLLEAGLEESISGYSYMGYNPLKPSDEYMVYLEEDCDAPKLLQALSDKGVTPVISYVHHDNTFVRSQASYDSDRIRAIATDG